MAVAGMAHTGSDGRHEVDAAVFHYFLWRHPGHDSGGDPADQTKTENGDRRASPGRRGPEYLRCPFRRYSQDFPGGDNLHRPKTAHYAFQPVGRDDLRLYGG